MICTALNNAMISSLIIIGVLCIFFLFLGIKIKKIDPLGKTPKWLVPFMWLVDLINGFVKENLGIYWRGLAPWFLTLTIYIAFANISAVYFLDNPTGYLLITATLGLSTFFLIQVYSIRSNGILGHLKGYLDPIPVFLPMNIISDLSLPVSLSLRLFGNVLSGVVISILIKETFGFLSIPIMPAVNLIFDIAFSLIQVMVFISLSVIFMSMKLKDEDKIIKK